MDAIKLIIWDLDDTLWQGTLAEQEQVSLNKEVIDRIEFLLDRGIVHSICSKNSETQAQKLLKKLGIYDFFIFPKIALENKGLMIKKIIEQCQLRPQNVLFVDDNEFVLREVLYHNPKILTKLTKEFMQEDVSLWGKEDKKRERLAQYKILEKKEKNRRKFSKKSQDEFAFLKECNISINLKPLNIKDPDIDRVIELVNRANQMNFTQSRIKYDYLFTLFELKNGLNFKIQVQDNYGDYGVVGYLCIIKNTLLHFVFSCRILGMAVESRMYQWLQIHYPGLKYSFNSSRLKNAKDNLDFIKVSLQQEEGKKKSPNDKKILLRGPCLVNAASFLLNEHYQVDEEIFSFFEYANLSFLKSNMENDLPTRFNKTLKALTHNEYHIIVNFLESDYYSGLYKIQNRLVPIASNYIFWKSLLTLKNENKLLNDHFQLIMLDGMRDIKKFNLENRFSPWPIMERFVNKTLRWFGEGWLKLLYGFFFYRVFKNYQGYSSTTQFKNTVNWYINLFPERIQLIFINPPEKIALPLLNEAQSKKVARRTQVFNEIMRDIAKNKPNILLLEMDEIIEQEDIIDSFSHLKRQGYIKLSQSLLSRVESCLSK